MERIGLISAPFEEIVNSLSLKFKDPELEDLYMEAQISLKFLTNATRRYLLFLCIAITLLLIFEITTNLTTPEIEIDTATWVVDFAAIFVILLEVLFYCCPLLSIVRGTIMTIYLIVGVTHNDYIIYGQFLFYPCDGGE